MLHRNWNNLIKPGKIEVNKLCEQKNGLSVSEIVVEPLEKGFGHTLGNALRRIMLSSVQGFAVKAIFIPGINHEYSYIDGVLEDLVQIIANIKKLVFVSTSEENVQVKLVANGEGPVYGKDIHLEGIGFKILNPDQLIMTLTADINLQVDFIIGLGKSYTVAEDNQEDIPSNFIPIDSLYNPVKLVSYSVENSRFGQVMDYDKLVMTITTNGVIKPDMAFSIAARILQDQLSVFSAFDDTKSTKDEKVTNKEVGLDSDSENPLLFRLADELDLSARAANCLRKERIYYIGDLVSKSEIQLLSLSNFGRKSLEEIYKKLQVFSKKNNSKTPLVLGMKINWPPQNFDTTMKKNNALLD